MDKPSYTQPPLQEPREWGAFLNILHDEGVMSYLEIGSMYGRSLWTVAKTLPKGSRLVAIDNMVDRQDARDSLEQCIAELIALGYDAHFIYGDSIEPEIILRAAALGPYDALFIDGNHSPEYVLSDWKNYGPMAKVVGFHDIAWNNTWVSARNNTPPADGSTMGAPEIWKAVKRNRRYKEFKLYAPGNYYGIGVIWNE